MDNNIKTSKNKLKTRYQTPHHIDLLSDQYNGIKS